MIRTVSVPDEAAMEALGARLAASIEAGAIVFLRGDLGAGKTTLVRGMLRALGVSGPVKSPTFTLVEPYATDSVAVCHFDLYRLTTPSELEAIGFRDYVDGENVCFVEWAERGQGFLPEPDVDIEIQHAGSGRTVRAEARSARGVRWIAELE